MKQLSFLALLLCFLTASAHAATVSGTITNSTTGNPQQYMYVTIADSLSSPPYYSTTITNSSGGYSFTLPASVAVGDRLTILTTDSCGTNYSASYTYTGANIVKNFTGCSAPSTYYHLQGRFSLPGATATSVRYFTAYIISKKYDPVVMDTTLTVVDSILTTSIYPTFYKTYTTLPAGTLLVKVALNPLDSEYANYLPTYYDSVLQWNNARPLTAANFTLPNFTDITMKRGVNPGGPGFIGGSVIAGANKSTATGDPLAKRLLILTNATTGKAVGFTYSDAAGKFQFANLAIGTYKIFGDVLGKSNPALTVSITGSAANVNNILFRESRKDFTGQIGGLSVANANPLLSGIVAFPNPATNHVEVAGLSAIAGDKTITLSAMNGAVISRQAVTAGQDAKISTTSLASGIYLLKVQTAEGSVQMKLTK